MATLLNLRHPDFEIYIPERSGWRKFQAGRLDIDKSDPDFEIVMAEAVRNPNIAIYDSVTTCAHCGEPFKSKAEVEKHVKDVHFEIWLRGENEAHENRINAELKRRASVFCDICIPHQEYPDEEALSAHVKALHLASGNEQEVEGATAPAPKKRQPPAKPEPGAPTKKELLARAAELKLELPKRATNDAIAKAIAEAEAAAKTES